MKTFKLIGMALIAITLCVNFAACSDDDDNNGSPSETLPNLGKRLVSITEDGEEAVLKYNSQGWLEKVTFTDDDPLTVNYSHQTATLTWGGDNPELEGEYTYDNLLRRVKYSHGSESCTYDEEGHLIQMGNKKLDWYNGNVISIKENGEVTSFTYYTNQENRYYSFVSDPVFYVEDSFFLIAHPQLLGKMSKNLVKTCQEGNTTYHYTYETDKDGYITKVIETDDYGDSTTLTLVWK